MKTKRLVQAALIAAVYILLTLAIAPISSGLIQCRLSEAMCVLPFFTPAAVPGLFIGCLVYNLISGALIYDVVFGSLATLLAAACTHLLSRHIKNRRMARALAPLPAVLFNALIVGYLLTYVYEVGVSFPLCALYVALGQVGACYAAGVPLMMVLEKYPVLYGNSVTPGGPLH